VVTLASAVQAEEATESVKTLVSSTTISGYVNTSAHWNPGNAAGTGAAYTFGGGKADGFNLDVVSLTISKPLDEGEWSAGYKAQLWFGPDANALGTGSLAFGNANDFNVKNAYVTLRAPVGNGIDFKMGVFDTIIGYESTDTPNNPNYTRSWGFTVEPTQHTGLLASYRFNDIVAASAGIANTYNPVINGRIATVNGAATGVQSQKTFMGALSLTAPDTMGFLHGGTLTAGAVDGRFGGAVASPDLTGIYVGATIPTPIESLKVGLAWDHVNLASTTATKTADIDAFAGYLSFQATEKLKLNLRGDYVDDGGGVLFGAGASGGASGVKPDAAEVVSLTATVDYALWENVISRLEYRWDHDLSNGQHFPGGTAASGRNNANLIALNVIYKF
jgi:hypothetical protein